MIINIAKINFNGGGGAVGGGAITVSANGELVYEENPATITIRNYSGDLDFTGTGYDDKAQNTATSKMQADLDYTKQKYSKWDPSSTSANSLYKDDKKLIYAPNINTQNVTNMESMFENCHSLSIIPAFDTSKVTNMNRMLFGCKSLSTVPAFDTSKVTQMNTMFSNCSALTTVPAFDTSKVTNMINMFSKCSALTTIPAFDTSKVTNMYNMFYYCQSLKSVPKLDTSNVQDMGYMFYQCHSLKSISGLSTQNVTNMTNMFYDCSSLTSLPQMDFGKVTNIYYFFGYSTNWNMTDLGGFLNLKIDWNDSCGLAVFPKLTHQSIINVLNGLYDFRANGDSATTKKIRFHSNAIALMTDEDKLIATNKGWVIS